MPSLGASEEGKDWLQFWDEDEALRALWDRSAYDKGVISNPFSGDAEAGLGLRRTAALLDRLGRPQDRYPIVHVAGSKGKGSTCAFAAAILRAAGARVGLHASPHLHHFRERFVVNDSPIAPAPFGELTQRVIEAAERLEAGKPELGRLTAFELSTALALAFFAEAGCDVAVVEVGMGGLLDATNIVDPAVSVITRLDWEHVAVLGPTMADIAANKAGIIKPNRPTVSVRQPEEATPVILAAAERLQAPLLLQDRDWSVRGGWRDFTAEGPWGALGGLTSALPGDHQTQNAGAAIAALWAARNAIPFPGEEAIRTGLAAVRLPGRYERVNEPDHPEIILDGAHTPASAAALAATVQAEPIDGPTVWVVGLLSDKDPNAFLAALAAIDPAARFIIAPIDSPRAADPAALFSAAERLGLSATAAPDLAQAAAHAEALAGSSGRVVVTGSLSLVAAARQLLRLNDREK
jgi:dihydrofolate synthase/folylpolyglutamate synthase